MNDRLPVTGDASEHAERNRWLWSAFARSVRDNMVAEFVVQALRVGGMVVLARALSLPPGPLLGELECRAHLADRRQQQAEKQADHH